ncbi:hypothetical protein G5B00_15960 [Parapedobacter sp. SGR-10]|uniref:polysaccharide lyase 6 family protein n=1 Tax=Parapedobacter sp. SGR-10 TaxID=2710879 RepID=UPI0013D16490|nr:polysaccharide lyase 6 family protein [Parapedobacter sp. SGR-10]NGF58012.1 hypothetical protein [Parapedobacter sp. SGR-10]
MKNREKKFLLSMLLILISTICVLAQSSTEKLVRSAEELQAAFANASPGDVIVMQDGTWKDINIRAKGNGTKDKPITLKAQTLGKVIISGNSSLLLSGEYLIVDGLHFKDGGTTSGYLIRFRDEKRQPANHSRITNIVVSEFNRPADGKSDVWVNLFGMYNRVDHCFFHGKTSPGRIMTIWRPTDAENRHQIDHNYFKDVPLLGKNGAEAIGVGASNTSLSDSYTTIEYNLFENCNGEGELLSIKSGRNIIRSNTVVRSQSSISLRHGNNNLVEGNFIFGDRVARTGGIRLTGENHVIKNNYIQGLRGSRPAIGIIEGLEDSPLHGYLQAKNITVAGNTMIDNELNLVVGDLYKPEKKQTMPLLNSSIKNNVIVGINEMYPLIKVMDESVHTTYQGNIIYNGLLVKQTGVKYENPGLMVSNGRYIYPVGSSLKGNIVESPLKRTDVGPSWIKGRWSELGIEDIPYVNH